ncbi:hypothetical protein [Nevskia ramosa]|uniref:hypothetical protein n=1 Tax=Nevskia ramosa TaxID=64002 RepID=UPI0003B7905B|nr:hypothetical protein [Nevskia ramosa]
MDYSKYRFSAVIDFIEFEIETSKHTNFQTVQGRLGLSPQGRPRYVHGLDEGPGGAATRFRFRLYDVESWTDVQATLDSIAARHPLVFEPHITAVEVAFDAYSKANDPEELTDMAATLYRFHTRPPPGIERFAGKDAHSGEDTGTVRSRRLIFASRSKTLYAGNQHDAPLKGRKAEPYCARIYVKVTNDGTPLPSSEHRTRFEITRQLEALPFINMVGAVAFDFTSLAEWFKWRRPRPGLNKLDRVLIEAYSGRIGQREKRNRREGGTRMHSRLTVADTALNRHSYDALRSLTKRLGT